MSDPKTSLGQSVPLVPPLYQSSVYSLPDLDALDRIMNAEQPGYIYARDAHPNARQLAAQLAQIENARWAVVCGSGMGAISAAVLATVSAGERIVASNRLYGRTTQLFMEELPRFGIETTLVDTNDLAAVRKALEGPAKMLFVETMSNPLLRVVDLEELSDLARERKCRLVVDNTFATPVLCRPLEYRADFVMESLTKMIGGHSDVTLGLLAGRDEDELPALTRTVSIWGLASNPFDCWLTQRGLTTLSLRMRAACANAAALADWLAKQSSVTRIVYPGRADHPDYEVATRMLDGVYGNMLCFEVDGGRDGVNRFMQQAKGVPFSPSLGNTTTTCSHPATTSHRYTSPAEKRRQGITDGLIRLSVGVEELSDIQREMAKGL
jgi:cystathionine beta-lyase/cystathionine gamma-synthase